MSSRQQFFSERLRSLRANQSQTSFAKILGIPQTTYSNFERGVREPGLEFLGEISTRLGVSLDWLLGLSDSQTSPRVTATGGSAAAANGSTATVSTGSSADVSRLIGIIESQQRVIETLTGGKPTP